MVKPDPSPASQVRLGRPRDPAKVESILDASWRLFLAHGVEPVSVDAIAAEAGVAKATVYAYFPDKRALFQEGVRREMAKIEAAQRLARMPAPDQTLREVLTDFGTGIMRFLASPGAVDFYGSLSGELRRDPELARMFYEAGPGRTLANLTAILRGPLARDLAIPDATAAAEMLMGLWQGMTSYRLMLGIDPDEVARSIPRRVETGVAVFMRAFGPGEG
jgi:TetR/AcrR family transcriptional repressor of mexJK operon